MPRDSRDEIDEELRFHVEERIRDYVAQGLSPDAARRAAAERLGDLGRVRTTCTSLLAADRAAQDRRTAVNVSWLDVKLGIRMLRKYPGLSAVAVIGMALAIAIGAGYFTVLGVFLDSTLPVDGGDRVMAIETRTVSGPDAGDRDGVTPYDFARFRAGLKSFTDLGAFRDDHRNVITADGRSSLAAVATMTASGFRLMRVPPLLGRTLVDDDERTGAAPVLVIGYDEWRRRFGADPSIVGTSLHLDDVTTTIVGVMPEGFAFPIQYQYWVPLRLTAADDTFAPDAVPSLRMFGQVAQGFSLSEARAELATYAHDNVRPQAQPYTQAIAGLPGPEAEIAVRGLQFGVSLLLVIVAVNVAILVYARTATRVGEIVVRTALGASRGRVVAQLFVEALVLSTTAAAIGLTVDGIAFRILREYLKRSPDMADRTPFWFGPGMTLSASTIVYVAGLTILAALVIGVLPALKATGRNVQSRLQQFSSRGSGLQLGRTWTALIVLQVAIAVAVLPGAIDKAQDALRTGFRSSAPAANDMLRGTLSLPQGAASTEAWRSRMADRTTALIQRLAAQPDVAGVTFAQDFPGKERGITMEAEDGASIDAASTGIAPDLLELFDVRLLAGRGFTAADARPGAATVIVDQTFASQLAPGTNVVGRRLRSVRTGRDGKQGRGPWLEIVGVVPAFADSYTAPNAFGPPIPRLYEAWTMAHATLTMVVRVKGGDPMRDADRFRAITAAIDPTLKLEDLQGVAVWWRHETQFFAVLALAIVAVTASVLLLSAAGIYAMMSFTVARRRREIGIRAALGADARRVLAGVFGRAGTQIGAGIAVGLIAATGLDAASGGQLMGGRAVVLLPSVVAVMLAVGLLAAIGPARRGLGIQPTEALRDE
jgi:predicted permease